MNKSIKALFDELEKSAPKDEAREAEQGVSPAERLGRAMLDRLGGGMDMSEDELVDAILDVWEHPDKVGAEEEGEEPAPELPGADAGHGPANPFADYRRMPKPIRGGAVAPAHIDYDELTDEQFRRLKKQLKKAAADGKKVRL